MRRTLQLLQCSSRRHDKPLLARGKALNGSYDLIHRELDRLDALEEAADLDTYSLLIRQCSESKALREGKRAHAHIFTYASSSSPNNNLFLQNLLVRMYGACGSLDDAKAVFDSIHAKNSYSWNIMLAAFAQNGRLQQAKSTFDQMPEKSVVSWTALISANAQNGNGLVAFELFCLMDLEGVSADHITFVSTIDACAGVKSLDLGRKVHGLAIESGKEDHFAVGTALISMYGKCKRVEFAKEMFDHMPERNMVSWTALITAYYQNGMLIEAREVYEQMAEWNVVSATALIAAYAQNDRLQEAELLFEKMACGRNAISWSTMMAAYNDSGFSLKALDLFNKMESQGMRLDKCTFVNVVNVCCSLGDLSEARRIHTKIMKAGLESNLVIANALINMFTKCGSSVDARVVFDRMTQKTLVSWNSIVAAFAQNGRLQDAKKVLEKVPEIDLVSWNAVLVAEAQSGNLEETRRLYEMIPLHDVVSRNAVILALVLSECEEEALRWFRFMDLEGVQPNKVTYSSVLEACSNLADLNFGRLIQSSVVAASPYASDAQVGTSLVTMFTKCESFSEAENAFQAIDAKNILACTAMMSSYAQSRNFERARLMFDMLPSRDVAAWNAMITGYAQFGQCSEARELFEAMPERNVISWTAMVSAYAESRQPKEAWLIFRMMDLNGQKPNKITYLKALEACAGGITEGDARTIHAKVLESGHSRDHQISIGLLNLYEKCGSVDNARDVFDELLDKTVVAWSILITAYSQAGHPRLSVELFQEMLLTGVMPSEITFVNLLSACSHGGFLNDSWKFFLSMISDFELSPFMDHYVCLVDVLGRCGLLRIGQELLQTMPFEPNDVGWTSLLSACKTQGDGKRGACIGEQIMDLHPMHSGPYRMVWNVYVTTSESVAESCAAETSLTATS